MRPHWEWEAKAGFPAHLVGGVDEVGRGCIAGPVVAAVCVSGGGSTFEALPWMAEVDDSKRLTHIKRIALDEAIRAWASDWAIGHCTPEEIDRWNILRASHIAMVRAVESLKKVQPQALLVDGNLLPQEWKSDRRMQATPIVRGDQQSMLIACASIIAKVFRDRWMDKLDESYPGFGFGKHKGYPTPTHLAALDAKGVLSIHRKSFAPVRNRLQTPGGATANPVSQA